MVCNLSVMKTQVEKRENPDHGVSCRECRKRDETYRVWTSRSALLGCRKFRKPDMWGTIAGSHVSVYMSCVYECVCVCVCGLCGLCADSGIGSGLFWWRFQSGFVYAPKNREQKVRPKNENGDCVWVPLHLCVVQLFMQNITRCNPRRERQIKLSCFMS